MFPEIFPICFRQLTGHVPFGWQRRLFEKLRADALPSRCDIPTGLGKTSILAVWLLALAEQASRLGTALRLPRRIVYIVDRRSVVDQASTEALLFLDALNTSAGTPLADAAAALHWLAATPGGQPFALSTLRGAMADNRQWLHDPTRPAIIIGTVDMIGSRLLFSGYGGLGPYNRSQHAALLGQDALIVLDEAQLAPAFMSTLADIERYAYPEAQGLGRPFAVMSLTATQPHLRGCFASTLAEKPVFTLEAEDFLRDEEVRRRVRASKALRILSFPSGENTAALTRRMADEAMRLARDGDAVAVFVNTVEMVDKIHDILGAAPHKVSLADRLQLTGQMRGHERDKVFSSGKQAHEVFKVFRLRHDQRTPAERRPVFLLATAAAEVGINFDADHVVCDLVPLERMAQRLGRLNRFGDCSAAHVSVFVPDNIEKAEKPLARTFELLTQLPLIIGADGTPVLEVHSASPEALRAILKSDADQGGVAYTPFSDPPPLDLARLDDWSMTSLRPADFPRPQVAYWLRGIASNEMLTVSFAWREELRYAINGQDAADMAQTLPPLPRELVQLPIGKAIKWLLARAKKHDAARNKKAADPHLGQFAAVRSSAGVWEWRDLRDFLEKEDFQRDIIGATIVLPTTFGGLSEEGQPDESCDEKTPDVLEEAAPDALDREKLYRRALLYGSPTVGWTAYDLMKGVNSETIIENDSRAKALREMAKSFDGTGENRRYRLVQSRTTEERANDPDDDEPEAAYYRVEYFASTAVDPENADDADDRSFLPGKEPVMLSDHLRLAKEFAGKIVARLPLPEPIREAVVRAAEWHDLGKHREHWQRAVGNLENAASPDPGKVWAKSNRLRFDHRETLGYRHEFGSMMEAMEKLERQPHAERDLILHLIAAHHGHGRPGFEEQAYDVPKHLLLECRDAAQEAELRFERLQRRFGWWGLAYLEALVKCADALASDAKSDTAPSSSAASPATPAAVQTQLSFPQQ